MSRSSASEDPLIGRVIAGRYEVERRIARGGMGVVYVAQHLRLHRSVVFKVLSEHLVDDARAVARFEQEALGLSRLNHPNVVTVHDFGIEDGVTYIVMEFVDGLTLSELLRREGVMTFERFLPLAAQIIEAIGAAHDKEIVHRDIKPANIMVVSQPDRADLVKVLDFGLARLTSSSLDITKDNLVGTVTYVAPEVVTGERAGKAADVYALGILFYFILTGRKPFKAEDDIAVLYKHVHDAPQPMGELLPAGHGVPERFIELVQRCMSKDPARRPRDGRALSEALSQIVQFPAPDRPGPGHEQRGSGERRPVSQPVEPGPAGPPASDLSVDLSSMALRDHPNSRWGLPLVALCVFVAGAAAVLLLASGGADADTEPADTAAEQMVADETIADPDHRVETTPSDRPGLGTPGPDATLEHAETSAASERGEEAASTSTGAPADGEASGRPGTSPRSDDEAGTASSPSARPAAKRKPKPLFEPRESEPELLDVDEKSSGGLLPVE